VNWKVGDEVLDLFDKKGLGVILALDGYLNFYQAWCFKIRWSNGEIETQHPKYLKKLSKLEKVLK
jgi:hypothetical protein